MRFKRSRRIKKWTKLNARIGIPNKVRPRHKRCPRCKKIRMWWLPASWYGEGRHQPGNLDGQRICWVCIKRHPVVSLMEE